MSSSFLWFKRFSSLVFTCTLSFAGILCAQNPTPSIGICTRYTNGEWMQRVGFAYVEEGVSKFLVPNQTDEDFAAILEDAAKYPLPVKACNGFIPSDMKSVGPDAVPVDILRYMETAFKRAQQAGVEIIVFGSGGSRNIPEGFSRSEARRQFIDLCKQMAPIAKKYGVTVVLEPLNSRECNFINSVAEGGEIVKAVNHHNFRLLADIYHMKKDNESPENIVKYGKLFKHVHIAEKQDRAVPGTYNEDFRPYFDALRKIDYKGRISIEAQWKDMQTQAPIAIETIKKQFNN
jgi:sugar phosphate isomerase/epimerase